MENSEYRFAGIQRLYGNRAFEKIKKAHICIIGLGGVGSWSAESLARTGVAKLTLVDMDEVCQSNTNRQIHALDGNFGKSKGAALKERIKLIHPSCEVELLELFYTPENSEEILNKSYDYIIDAFDSMWNKAHLIDQCVKRKIKLCTMGGAGGRMDPTKIRVDDLNFTLKDPFCFLLRKNLKRKYGFSSDKKTPYGVDCVFSIEEVNYLNDHGEVSHTKNREQRLKLDCRGSLGSATQITGSFGFAAAHAAISSIISQ